MSARGIPLTDEEMKEFGPNRSAALQPGFMPESIERASYFDPIVHRVIAESYRAGLTREQTLEALSITLLAAKQDVHKAYTEHVKNHG